MSFFEFQEKMTATRSAPAAPKATSDDAKPLTVSQVTRELERVIKQGLPPHVLIQGEVSNYKHHGSSGHAYFTLKDPDACIDCVMFRNDVAKLKFIPKDGMELIAGGRVGVYGQRGRYQLYATSLQPVGQGALELAFRQLCEKLERQGLFAPERKKPLPLYPLRIALVTSRSTAALQDMLKVLRRFPWVRLSLFHCSVQGTGAGDQIASAVRCISDGHTRLTGRGVDLILLARGGGSLEDLWAFNEEVVARAIAASRVPVITGIGHEIDVSIADLVADYHAHTPTEAAQVAVAQWRTVGDAIDSSVLRLRRGLRGITQDLRHRLSSIERHEVFRRPLQRVQNLHQVVDDRQRSLQLVIEQRLRGDQRRLHELSDRLDQHRPQAQVARLRQQLAELEQRLQFAAAQRLRRSHERVSRLTVKLRERHPRHTIALHRQRLSFLQSSFRRAAHCDLDTRKASLLSLARHLDAIGPEQVLRRGYTITIRKKDGTVIRSAFQLKGGERLLTRLADGQIESIAEDPVQLPLFE